MRHFTEGLVPKSRRDTGKASANQKDNTPLNIFGRSLHAALKHAILRFQRDTSNNSDRIIISLIL